MTVPKEASKSLEKMWIPTVMAMEANPIAFSMTPTVTKFPVRFFVEDP